MEVNFEDWQQWAVNNEVHPDVIGYLSYSKADLFDFDPKSNSQAFASPRSWVFVSEMLNVNSFDDASKPEQLAELAGAVGEGMARKFAEHRKVAAYLPNPEEVLKGSIKKLDSQIASEISAKYSLVVSLAYEMNESFKQANRTVDADVGKKLNNLVRFAFNNFEPEMVIFALKTLMKDYQIVFNFRKVLDKELQTTFNDRYLKYIV
jgi:hypothetical protein